jgi:hypothetical protein
MAFIKLEIYKFISVVLSSIIILTYLSQILHKTQIQTTQTSIQFPPCNYSSQVLASITKSSDNTLSLISIWDKERLEELWPAQGIPRYDTGGGINSRQSRRYWELASMDTKFGVNVVCETGFFRGGSTLFWLMLFPNSIVHSFDILFPESAVKWFNQKYPDRLVIHKGDSKALISDLPKNTCDWVSVDGDHGQGGAYHDIIEFSKVSKPMALLVSDDTFDCKLSATSCTECGANCPCSGSRPFCNECSDGFRRSIDENIIDWSGCDRYGVSSDGKYPIGSCHGYFRIVS